jgi:hypothetical protein
LLQRFAHVTSINDLVTQAAEKWLGCLGQKNELLDPVLFRILFESGDELTSEAALAIFGCYRQRPQ